jgi:hypothetical protein
MQVQTIPCFSLNRRLAGAPGKAKQDLRCGCSSEVERQLPKLNVVGSIPIARSNTTNKINTLPISAFTAHHNKTGLPRPFMVTLAQEVPRFARAIPFPDLPCPTAAYAYPPPAGSSGSTYRPWFVLARSVVRRVLHTQRKKPAPAVMQRRADDGQPSALVMAGSSRSPDLRRCQEIRSGYSCPSEPSPTDA